MTDWVSPETRSRIMARVSTKNTSLEKKLRSSLHSKGLRFRLHAKRLPGTPDIVFPLAKVAVQARGCFWHAHTCKLGEPPVSNQGYWLPKLAATRRRDHRDDARLRRMGWSVLTVWQCKVSNQSDLGIEIERIAAKVASRRG